MKNLILLVSCLAFGMFSPAWAAGPVTRAKAAELALHRAERLVILKKIEESFQTKLKGVLLEVLSHEGADQPAFKATLKQVAASDGSQKSVEILLADDGRALGFNVPQGGGEPQGAPEWPDRDAATLAENALHYILDNSASDPKLAPFNQGLAFLALSVEPPSAGSTRVAQIAVETQAGGPVLKIYLRADATVESAEVVPHQ